MTEPKLVVFDLEIIPDLNRALEVWPRIGAWPGKTLRASVTSICNIGYKIYGEDKVHVLNAWDYEDWDHNINDDYSICADFFDIIKDADAVITHNGRRFDWKYLQTRLMKHGIGPLPDLPNIDTKQIASSKLFLFDNKLDTLSDFFLEDKKLDHEGWDLWVKVCQNDKKAQKKMTEYCAHDVLLTEKNFVKLKPLIKNIPNYNLFQMTTKKVCSSCSSTRLKSNGYRHTKTRSYMRMQCLDCRSWTQLDASGNNPRSV